MLHSPNNPAPDAEGWSPVDPQCPTVQLANTIVGRLARPCFYCQKTSKDRNHWLYAVSDNYTVTAAGYRIELKNFNNSTGLICVNGYEWVLLVNNICLLRVPQGQIIQLAGLLESYLDDALH